MNLSDFAAQHWVIGGTVASLLWLLGAKQSSQSNHPGLATAEVCIAAIIIVIMGGWAAWEKQWLGLITATVVLFVELRELRRFWHSHASGC